MTTASPRARARAVVVAFALAAALVLAFPAAADDDVEVPADCGLLAVDDGGGPSCRDEAQELHATRVAGPSCRVEADAVFYAGTDWIRLADALARTDLPCGSYAVSVPALANNKMGLRVLQDDEIRKRGIEALAEVSLSEPGSWDAWRRRNGKTWFDVGVQFRRAMVAAGYEPGERWSVNELDYATIRDPSRRADMGDLLRGLYYGDIGMPPLQGIALLGVPFRQQNIPDVGAYRRDLQGFLADAAFWRDVDQHVQWFGNEVYADTRNWGVDGSSRNDRRRHLEDYMFHMLELVETGPDETAVARDVLERKYLPMANAIWRARGGEKFNFTAGAGNTIVDSLTMQRFVSEQVYAIRTYQGSHPHRAPAGAIAFAWQPCNRPTADVPGCPAQDAAFVAGLDAVGSRMAESIANAYRQGGASPVGACRVPGSEIDWCDVASVPGAAFTDAWADFRWAG